MLRVVLYYNVICFFLSLIPLVILGHRIKKGHWVFSLGYLILLSAAGSLVHRALGGSSPPQAVILSELALGIAVIAVNEDWNLFGHGTFWALMMAVGSFLSFAFYSAFSSHLGSWSLGFSILLLFLQAATMVLMIAHTQEILDVICRIRWRHVVQPQPVSDFFPRVSLHVPAYNEPPEMVKETLSALSRIDYPNFEVVMVDDNTKDETLWRPVEEHCRSLGFKFCHLDDWPGYKSGALNFALKQTDPDAEIIGVIDSDYMVEPGYLRDLVGLFRNRDVAFVQTPQDYRDFDTADVYAKACYDAYRYFFRISMAARNEHNGIIFAGTMGLIRRDVLERMGGWDEWCITEDAELSIRILHEGHRGLYVDRTYGRGLMPLDYEGLKKQRFRWAFGGMQILRMHWRKMLPRWRGKRPKSGLSWAQQAAYLNGALQWLNDPLTLVFTAILFIGVGAFATGGSLVIQPMVGSVIFVPFTFLLFSLLRFLWALRVRLSCSWRDAYRALTILLGLIWVVSLACVQGLTRRQGVFLRTPKKREGAGMASSLSIVRWETILAALCIGGIGVLLVEDLPRATRFLLMGLMTWQFMIYSAAPLSLLWSRQSANAMAGRPRHVGYRTVGHLIGNFVGESRTTLKIAACVLVAVLLFWLAATNLTERERILSMTDDHAYLSRSFKLIRNPSPIEIKALIHDEGRSALSGQVDQAVSLWTRDGFIHDMNFTPANPLDDRFWNGIDDIRRRYREEFAQRTYRRLEHKNISVRIDGDRARAENDLYALIETPRGMETVILRRSDQWTFKREEGDWKIESLTLNTVPR